MSSIGINIYSLSIYGSDAKEVELHNIVNSMTLIELVNNFISNNKHDYIDDTKQEFVYGFEDWKIVKRMNQEDNEYMHYLYGVFKTGDYGIEEEIVDKHTMTITHVKKAHEASLIPFSFLVALPKDDCFNTVAIFQTHGRYGMKTSFERGLSNYLRNISKSYKIHFGPLYPKEFINKYLLEGVLKKINLVRYNISRDEADRFGVNEGKNKVQQVISVTSSMGFKNKILNNIKECIYGQRAYTAIVEIDSLEYDDLKLEFKIGSKEKIISLRNMERLVVNEDITNDVELKNGNPTKDTILPIMVDNAIGYLIEMGLLEKIDQLNDETLSEYKEDGEQNDEYNKHLE